MKQTVKCVAMLMVAMTVGLMASCGSDDDGGYDSGSETVDVTQLVGKTYSMEDASYGKYDGSSKTYEVEFKNERLEQLEGELDVL